VVLLGQSCGGWLARLVAVRRPDLVRGLVTAEGPVLDPLGANPNVVRVARLLTRLSTLGMLGLLAADCFTGSCYRTPLRALDVLARPDNATTCSPSMSNSHVPVG
jgi:pimeloyl-ACP methyl ester carboxylesterase